MYNVESFINMGVEGDFGSFPPEIPEMNYKGIITFESISK